MIGNSEVDGTRVEKLLSDTNMKLAKIDRSHLRTEDGSTSQQATEFAHAARRALEEGDYLVGSGLAEKACILTNTIAAGHHLLRASARESDRVRAPE